MEILWDIVPWAVGLSLKQEEGLAGGSSSLSERAVEGHRSNLGVQRGWKKKNFREVGEFGGFYKFHRDLFTVDLHMSQVPIGKSKTSKWKIKEKRLSGPHGKRLTQVLRAQTSCLVISGLIQASWVRETARRAQDTGLTPQPSQNTSLPFLAKPTYLSP